MIEPGYLDSHTETLPVKTYERTGYNGQRETINTAGENHDTYEELPDPCTQGSMSGT